MLVLVSSFSYTPDDISSEVFLSVASLMLILVMSLSCTPGANFRDEFLLHS